MARGRSLRSVERPLHRRFGEGFWVFGRLARLAFGSATDSVNLDTEEIRRESRPVLDHIDRRTRAFSLQNSALTIDQRPSTQASRLV